MIRYTQSRNEVKSSDLTPSDELFSIVKRWAENPESAARVDAAVMQSVTQYPPDEWRALENFYREVER